MTFLPGFAHARPFLLAMFISSFAEADWGSEMSMSSFGVYGPEAIAEMGKILEAAFQKLQNTGEPDVVRECIAARIIAAARFGERDPARLLEAALRRPD